MGRRNKRLGNKTCPHCGSEFLPYKAESKYCSQPCVWANNGAHNKNVRLEFIENVALGCANAECLNWPFSLSNGYGSVRIAGRLTHAHRYVCLIVHGEPPTHEHQAAHNCGNRACVNPLHLRWADRVENAADKLIHGTHNRGERCGSTKLTEVQAREIIRLKGKKSPSDLAAEFGVSRSSIYLIHQGVNWAWLSPTSKGEAL